MIAQQCVINQVERGGIFIFFAIRQNNWHTADVDALQGMPEPVQIERCNRRIGHNGRPLARQTGLQ